MLGACSADTPVPTVTSSASQVPSTPPSQACAGGSLLSPGGSRVDLSGAWQGASGSYQVSQIGSCVWWVALSSWPENALGSDWQFVFRGEISPDFTLSGDWAFVYIDNYAGRPSGKVAYQIEFASTNGTEEASLNRISLSGPPFPDVVLHLDYPAETLHRLN